jgi:hypothetical protein
MRSNDVRFLLVFGLSFWCACGPRPDRIQPDNQVNLPPQNVSVQQKAVWFATSNYTQGGTLARLDLATGDLNQRVLDIGPDVIIFPDGSEGLLALNRTTIGRDSLMALTGPGAAVSGVALLPGQMNPQGVARDAQGRPWVVGLESNRVHVLSADLSGPLGTVDLSGLVEADSTDGVAELAHVTQLGEDRMVISAQRLRRTAGLWPPEPQSGIAIVRSESLELEYLGMVNVPNPTAIFADLVSFAQDPRVIVLGSGDLSGGTITGASSSFSPRLREEDSAVRFPYRIIFAHFWQPDQPPAVIAWYKQENKSCVQIGEKKLICEGSLANGGYVFNRVLRHGNLVFVSYIASGASELWIVSVEDGSVRKVSMRLPIESMSFGP